MKRFHAGTRRVSSRGGRWFVADLGSRHGTYLSGVKLEPNNPAALDRDDLLRIGPWTFRVRLGSSTAHPSVTLQDSGHTTERVERVPDRELAWVAQHRLTLLIECSAAINAASTDEGLVAAASMPRSPAGGFVAWPGCGREGAMPNWR
jgi:predicted component of type VI protein secretion system